MANKLAKAGEVWEDWQINWPILGKVGQLVGQCSGRLVGLANKLANAGEGWEDWRINWPMLGKAGRVGE